MKGRLVLGFAITLGSTLHAFAASTIETARRTSEVFPSDSLVTIALSDESEAEQTIAELTALGVLGDPAIVSILPRGFRVLRKKPSIQIAQLLAAALSHPNVVCAKPLEEDERGLPYNVLDLVVVRYAGESFSALESALVNELHLTVVDSMRSRRSTRVYSIGRESCDRTVGVSNDLNSRVGIEWSEPAFASQVIPLHVPNDSLFGLQWNFRNTGQNGGTPDADIDLDSAWEVRVEGRLNYGDSSVVISVIDAGLDPTPPNEPAHGDLVHAVVDSGWDFVGPIDWYHSLPDDDPRPGYYQNHGMACAGLTAGTTDNTYGLAGISKFCRIIPVKVASDSGFWPPFPYLMADPIGYAVDRGAMIINCSWGSVFPSQAVIAEIARGVDTNPNGFSCLFVCAAGNSPQDGILFPANAANTLAVGASDKNDIRCDYSAWGSALDVVAPSGPIGCSPADVLTIDRWYTYGWNLGSRESARTSTQDGTGRANSAAPLPPPQK